MTPREIIDQRHKSIYGVDHDMADDMAEFGAQLNTREGYHRHCTGPCDQGRKACPCPQDCQQPDDQSADAQVFPMLLIFACFAVLLCWHVVAWLEWL